MDAKCPGGSCQCCARPCTPRQSCVDAGGVCIEDQKDCKDGILDSDGCDGYKCMCCKPLSKEEWPEPLCHKFVLRCYHTGIISDFIAIDNRLIDFR